MKTMGKVSVVLAIIFAVSFVLSILTGPVLLFGGFESAELNQFERASIQDISSLNINVPDPDVKMYPIQGEDFEFSLVGSYAKNSYDKNVNLSVERTGNTVNVKIIYPNSRLILINKDFNVNIGIPEDYKEKITVGSASGNIDIRNLDTKGFEVKTLSGEIEIENINNSGNSLIKSSSGNIDIKNFDSSDIKIESISEEIDCNYIKSENEFYSETSSGDIEIKNLESMYTSFKTISGEVLIKDSRINSVTTTSGNVEIYEFYPENDLTIKTTSGEVLLELKKNSSVNVDYETISGDLENNFGDIYEGEYRIFVKTASGNLNILKEI